jgi:hypothetical protein
MTKYLLFVLLPILFYACNSEQNQRLPPAEGRSLQPSSDYPEYWSWDGNTPTLLLGGSSSAAPFLEEDWKEELNYLVKAGGNYVNFAMPVSTTPGRNPFISTEDKSGNINVDSEKQYWKKLDEYLSHANDLSVVVEIQVWDHANFSAENREKNAWTAAGGMADTLLPREFVAGEHPFFQTVEGAAGFKPAYKALWAAQHAYVDQLLTIGYSYPNVIFNVRVPSNLEIPWMVYWGKYIEAEATEMYGYPGQKLNLNIGVEAISGINVAIFNRKLLRGASTAFHRPEPQGNGLNGAAQASIRGVRVVEQHLKFWDLRPAPDLLLEDDSEAIAATDGKGNYLIYLPGAGSVNLAPDWEEQLPVKVTVVGYLGTQRSELLEPPYGDSFRLYTEEDRGGWMLLEPVR